MSETDRLFSFLMGSGFFDTTFGIFAAISKLPASCPVPFTLKGIEERLKDRQGAMFFMESVANSLDLSHEYGIVETWLIYRELAIFLLEFLTGREADVLEFWESLPFAPSQPNELRNVPLTAILAVEKK